MKSSRFITLVTVFALVAGSSPAGEPPQTNQASQESQAKDQNTVEIQVLKKQLAEQQKQIEELRLIVLGQKKQIDSVTNKEAVTAAAEPSLAAPATPAPGRGVQVASTVPYLPATVLAKASALPLGFPAQAPPKPAEPANP